MNNELINAWREKALIRISEDKANAYLSLYTPKEDEKYTVEEILELLAAYNISYGIDRAAIEKVIEEKSYYVDVLVAKGTPQQNGLEGKYNFFFDTQLKKKPIVMEDGSIDYNTLGQIVLVKAGDPLVSYHKAVPGIDGMSVFGEVIPAKNYNDLAVIKGKGFTISEDESEYFAAVDGKVEMQREKLVVSELLVIENDVDATTGDINFNGDVLVKGSVYSGTMIKASGNITVNGCVEAASILAGKSVLLRNGMQGAEKGLILAKGDISGKFFELSKLKSKGFIRANAIMNCDMESDEEIIVSGKRGIIIGGVTKAVSKVTASIIGNKAEVYTEIQIGLNFDIKAKLEEMELDIKNLSEELERLEKSIRLLTARIEKKALPLLIEKRMELTRAKINYNAMLAEKLSEKEELLEKREKSMDGMVVVLKTIFTGSKIIINGSHLKVEVDCNDVTLKRKGIDVCIFANH